MDLFVLNNHQSDGSRPEITRLPQSSGIIQSFLIVNTCSFKDGEITGLNYLALYF